VAIRPADAAAIVEEFNNGVATIAFNEVLDVLTQNASAEFRRVVMAMFRRP
jgi:hypothetical protein